MRVRCWWPCLLALLLSAPAAAEEYFLDQSQRVQLLMDGRITGRDDALYDIWIVPGYRHAGRQAGAGWRHAREDLRAYGKPDFFPRMMDATRDVMRFARREVIAKFAIEGAGEAWADSVASAGERTRRRVFGWQFAWPWALVEASAESVVRVGLGVPGGVGLWAGGAVVTPVAYTAWPAVLGTGHALGQGVAFPLVSAGWNTVIAPPLALVGQQPAPERADGWWMKRLADPKEADIRARLEAWQAGWRDDPALAGRRAALAAGQADHEARVQSLRDALAREDEAWRAQADAGRAEYRRLALARAFAALPALRAAMGEAGYSPARLQAQREVLLDDLVASGLSREDAAALLAAWLGGAEPPVAPVRAPGDKTDPLQQVIERAPVP